MAATDNEKNINDGFTQQEEEVEFKSKTQLKRESEALQKLGTELVNLTEASLKKMPLDDELFDAISQAQRINRKKDGFRRQLQFIGKLMRSRDCDPIALALTRLKAPHQAETQAFHKLETMRDDMLKNGDDAVQAALESHPAARSSEASTTC